MPLTHLECTKCSRRYEPGQVLNLCECGGPLFARYNLERAAKFKQFFNQFTATQIETKFGYPTGEGAVIKSAFNELNVLNQIFLGNATLAQSGSGSATAPRARASSGASWSARSGPR